MMSNDEYLNLEEENKSLSEKVLSLEKTICGNEEKIGKIQKENENQSQEIKMLQDKLEKNKDQQMEEKNNLMSELQNTVQMHHQLLFYSIEEDRRCLGEYKKLSEEKNKQEYELLINEGTLDKDSACQKFPIFKQKGGTYTLMRKEDFWQIWGTDVSFFAKSATLFPPTTGWMDENGDPVPAITVALSGSLTCRQIEIQIAEQNIGEIKEEEGEEDEVKTLETELGDEFLGVFERVENKFSYGRAVFRNEHGKYLSYVKIKPGKGKEHFGWTVLNVDTDTWKEESKSALWFSLFERMGVCPAIKPKEELKEKVYVYVKSTKKFPFKDMSVRLEIKCKDHGGGLSGPETKRKISKQSSRRNSTVSIQSEKD